MALLNSCFESCKGLKAFVGIDETKVQCSERVIGQVDSLLSVDQLLFCLPKMEEYGVMFNKTLLEIQDCDTQAATLAVSSEDDEC